MLSGNELDLRGDVRSPINSNSKRGKMLMSQDGMRKKKTGNPKVPHVDIPCLMQGEYIITVLF